MFIIKPHKDDNDVFEIVTKTKSEVAVWAIILKEFLYDADPENSEYIYLALKAGEELKCELVIKENC